MAAFLCLAVVPLARAQGVLFDDLQYAARALVITGDEYDPKVMDFLDVLKGRKDGLFERDMVVIHYHGQVMETIADLSIFRRDTRILDERGESRYFEQVLGARSDVFSVSLVGKDGRVKDQWFRDAPEISAVFEAIDAMPMREREIEEGLR